MAKIYQVHPPMGIARLGNNTLTGTVGDYLYRIPGMPDYKEGGKIHPLPAYFQIWEHEFGTYGNLIRSKKIDLNTLDVEFIEWSVHLSNKKAAFFKFDGMQGEATPNTAGFRNANPHQWVMDAGVKKVNGKNIKGVKLEHRKNTSTKKIPTSYLGELWTDDMGSLLVFGGKGVSKSINRSPIVGYANNPTWFDDVSDGPIIALLKFKGKPAIKVEPSWVIVAPPDYAPETRAIVTLYDAIVDAMMNKNMPFFTDTARFLKNYPGLFEIYEDFSKNSFNTLSTYMPHFHNDVLPILERGINYKYVSSMASPFHNYGLTSGLSDAERTKIFNKMRGPGGLGGNMPMLHGDDYGTTGSVNEFLPLTKTQYEILKRWKDGNFIKSSGVTSAKPPFDNDIKVLQSASGGAFYPGIEAGWLIRNSIIYWWPFRINHSASDPYKQPSSTSSKISSGFFTRQMAVPWQADFHDCQFDGSAGWWPSQRPDDVYENGTATTMIKWFRDGSTPITTNGKEMMVQKWYEMGFVVKDASSGKFYEDFKNVVPSTSATTSTTSP